MKIVNIILTSQNGGAEQSFIDYCNILKNRLNHQILAIVKTDAPYISKLEELQITTKKIRNIFGYNDFFAIKNIQKILQDFDADAVICHAGRSMVLVRKAIAKIKNKKIMQVAINHSENVKRSIGADLVLSVNKEIFYKTIDQGQAENRSFVVSNTIDFKIDNNFRSINFNKNPIVIGIIGRFEKTKNFATIIKVIKILEKSTKNFILKIAGNGDEENNLRNLARSLKIEDKVEFLGWIDKENFFNEIDIFILPSKKETFGLVILEAMKFKKPIISSDCDGPKEILRDKIDALIFQNNPQRNVEERIVEKILQLINDEKLANEMVKNAYKRLQERFSFDFLQKKLQDIFGNYSIK
ncbi:MAG TPA: glycosyltransferase family 4 protein [Rickettsiales bacterium]|nr:glycosyltransferase family 4 protein [Rickettsiales bacterium]